MCDTYQNGHGKNIFSSDVKCTKRGQLWWRDIGKEKDGRREALCQDVPVYLNDDASIASILGKGAVVLLWILQDRADKTQCGEHKTAREERGRQACVASPPWCQTACGTGLLFRRVRTRGEASPTPLLIVLLLALLLAALWGLN